MKQIEDELNTLGYGLDLLKGLVGVGVDASNQCSSTTDGCVPGCEPGCKPGCVTCTSSQNG